MLEMLASQLLLPCSATKGKESQTLGGGGDPPPRGLSMESPHFSLKFVLTSSAKTDTIPEPIFTMFSLIFRRFGAQISIEFS